MPAPNPLWWERAIGARLTMRPGTGEEWLRYKALQRRYAADTDVECSSDEDSGEDD